jgi:26S proteasome regulatory subunit T4
MAATAEDKRSKAIQDYRKKLLEHREIDDKLKERKKMNAI